MKTTFYLVLILAVSLPFYLKAQTETTVTETVITEAVSEPATIETVTTESVPEPVTIETVTAESGSEPDQAPALISVSGYGISNVQPDEVQVTISIQQQDDSVDELNDLINNITSSVTKVLKDANVTDEDIQSSSISVWPYYSTSSPYGSSSPASYQGKKAITFTLKNNSDYDAVITDLYTAGINSVDSVIFQLSNGLLQAKKMEARRNAAANLMDSLNTLVGGLGLDIGNAYTVSEYTYGGDPQPYYGYQNTRYAVVQAGEVAIVVEGEGGSGGGPTTAIPPDDFLITSTISAQYYIV